MVRPNVASGTKTLVLCDGGGKGPAIVASVCGADHGNYCCEAAQLRRGSGGSGSGTSKAWEPSKNEAHRFTRILVSSVLVFLVTAFCCGDVAIHDSAGIPASSTVVLVFQHFVHEIGAREDR